MVTSEPSLNERVPGFVYAMINYAMPGKVKIGRSDKDATRRAAHLSRSTSVPDRFRLVHQELVSDNVAVERELHELFAHRRPNSRREFFDVEIHEAVKALVDAARRHPCSADDESARVSVLADMRARFKDALRDEIADIAYVQVGETALLELVTKPVSPYRDVTIERVDLGFIFDSGCPDGLYFHPSNSPSVNSHRLVTLASCSIVDCFALLTDEANDLIEREWETSKIDPYPPTGSRNR